MTITKKKTKYGTKYYAQVCVDGQRPGKLFDKLSDAARWQEETIERLRSGKGLPSEEGGKDDIPFIAASDRAITESHNLVSVGTLENYRYAQKQFAKSFGEKATLASITAPDVSAHILRRINEDSCGVSIIRTELAFLRKVYDQAKTWGYQYPSPEIDIKRPRHKTRGREESLDRVIKAGELKAIMTAAQARKNNLYEYLMVLLYSGMRPSEAASLYWRRLPARDEREKVKQGLPVGFVDPDRGGFSMVGTKTEPRFVPMHPILAPILESLRHAGRLVFLPDEYIDRDRPYRHYRRTFDTTTRHAAIDGERIRQDITFYSFRHTFRSRLEECGVSTGIAEVIIGHAEKDFKFTYLHLSDQALVDAVARLSYPGI